MYSRVTDANIYITVLALACADNPIVPWFKLQDLGL